MTTRLLLAGLACLTAGALSGCNNRTQPTAPGYVVGAPYQAGGLWRYPAEDFTLDQTGIATVASRSGATANGESFDSANLAAAHRTLQLPAIARLTNLDNGRQVVVRVNDRGPADPARLVAVTRRTAQLLGAPDATAFRVRLQVLEAESRQLATELQNGAPTAVQVAVAPRPGVQAEALAPPQGTAASTRQRRAAVTPAVAPAVLASAAAIPLRLPEQVTQGSPRRGPLAIECGAFGSTTAASLMVARLARFGARMQADYNAPRDRSVLVRIGPLPSLTDAEATLRRVLPAGCLDGRIVVE